MPRQLVGTIKDGKVQPKQDTSGGIVPAIAGTAGSVAGGIGGTFVEPGGGTVVGSIAGGALGQGLGEFVQELFNKQKPNPKDIAAQGAEGGLFGAIPGGAEDNLGIRLLSRMGMGFLTSGGAQIIDSISKGEKIDHNKAIDILMGSGVAGVGSAILPETMKGLSEFAFGDAQKLQKELAKSFVSAKHADNPEVVKNIDFGSWQNTVSNLKTAMGNIYKPLQVALSKQNASFGDFMNGIKEGLNKTSLHQDVIDRNFKELIYQAGRLSPTAHLSTLVDTFKTLDKSVPNYPGSTGGKVGQRLREMFLRKEKVLEEIMQQNVPLSVANELKKTLGESGIYSDAQGAYEAARKFIEDNAKGVDVQGINRNYNDIKDASDQVSKRFGNATRDIQTGEPYSWTMRAGMTSALSLIPAIFGITGHAQQTLISGLPLATYFLKQHMMQNPATAEPYIKTVGAAEKNIPALTSQIVQRIAPQIGKMIQELFGGGTPPEGGTPEGTK